MVLGRAQMAWLTFSVGRIPKLKGRDVFLTMPLDMILRTSFAQ